MPWRPLPRIAFAIAVYPFAPAAPADLPLELGDELYIIEEGGKDGSWLRGYLVAPPSLLSGLTSIKGQTLEARVFSGIFPRSCVEIREYIGAETEGGKETSTGTRGGNSKAGGGGGGGGGGVGAAAAGNQVNGLSPIFIDDDDFHRLPTGAPPGNVLKQPTLPPSSIESSWPPLFNGIGSTPGASPEPDGRGRSASTTDPLTPVSLTPKDGRMPRPPAPVPMLKIGDETPTCANEPLVDEIASCLREWHSTNLHELLLSREYTKLAKLTRLMNRLDMARRQLLHGVLTAREVEDLHEKVVWDMVRGNKLVNNEIIVRDPRQRGRLLTASDNVNEISKLSASMGLLDAPAKSAPEPINLHHILVEVVDVVNNLRNSQPSLLVAIYKKLSGENPVRLSESFAAEAPQTDRKSSSSRLRTLFTDFSQIDVGELSGSDTEVYVVIRVQANVAVKGPPPPALARAPTTAARPSQSASENASNGISNGEGTAAKEGGFNRAGRRSLLWGANKLNNARRRIQPPTTIEEGSSGSTPSHSNERESGNRPTTSNNDSTSSSNGGSQPASAQKAETAMAKRDIGVAVLKLGDLMSAMASPQTEHTITVYAPAEAPPQREHEIDDWNPVIAEIMKSPSGRFEDCAGVTRVQLRIQSFIAPNVDDLIRRTPTALLNIHKTPKIGFPGAPKHVRSDIYITVTEPVLPPNASFAHPQRGGVQLTESVDKQNLQLTLEVRRSNGKRVDHCIYPTSNSNGVTAWRTTAIQRGSAWRQTIRLSIPPEDVPDCHIIMSIADAPNFPFALAWMPLWSNGAFIEDGTHMPLLYVYDKFTSRQDNGRGAYLDMEWDSRRQASNQSFAVQSGTASILRIETYLCSTELTQDQVVLSLLNWRHQTSEQLSVVLRQLPFVQETELVKLGQDIWEVLFQILTERDGQEEFEDLVLNNLVFSCSLVRDRRFSKKPQIVTMYIEEDFNYPHVALPLLRSLRRLFERTKDYQNSRHLNGTIKSGKMLMHLIVRSRLVALEMQNNAPGSAEVSAGEAFYNEARALFQAFEGLMRSPLPAMIGSKALLMQHVAEWAELLKQTIRRTCLWALAQSFIDSTAGVTGKLLLHRLSMILAFCKILQPLRAEYLEEGFDLSLMDQKIHDWIAPYWGSTKEVNEQYRDQVRLCVSIIALRVTGFGEQHYPYYTKLHESFLCLRDAGRPHKHVFSPLFPTAYPFTTRAIREENPIDEALLEITSVLSAYRDKPVDPDAYTADRIMVTFEVLRSIVDGRAFPNSWLTLSLTHHRSCLFMVQKLFGVMQERHLPEPEQPELFRTDLWKSLFMSLLTIVSSENLALETFPEQKRRAVWKIAGDVREVGAGLLARCWSAIGWEVNETERAQYGLERLGGWQVQYVPHLVGPIIELCLSVHAGLRSTAVQILQSMIISEWSISGDLAVIQHAIVDCLNYLLKHKNMAENAQQKLFIVELMDLFEPLAETNDNELWEAFKDLISVVEDLLDLMVVVHSPDTSDVFRTMNTLRLMDFLRDMQKEDVFISYVHQLADSEAQARCFKEAGLALRLHAELYEWDASKTVEALSSPVFPEQTSFERRERLYFEMIRHFEEGAAYGCALDCYRELAHHYENTSFDFAKLARTQRSMAKCHELIAKGECQTPRYFKVVYKGLGFPPNLRDKQYVFEGNGSERLVTFTDRLQREHPSARLVGSTENTDGEGQYLHVTAVTPYRDLKHPLYQRGKVGFAIKEYVLSESPVNFALTTRRHSPRTGVKDQWVEKTVYTTAEVFPTILRRSEIIAEEVLPLSPIQTAIERTVRKASELWTLQTRLREGDDNSTYSLVEAIRTSVDPYSSTSVSQYRDMLPKSDDRRFSNLEDEEPTSTEDPMQNALRVALFDFTYMLRHCFNTYGRNMPSTEYQKLLAQYQTTYAPEIEHLAPLPNSGSEAFNPLQISDPTFQVMPPTPTNAAEFSVNRTPHEETQDTFPSTTFRDRPVLNSETRTPSRGNRLSMLLKRKPSTANSSDAEPTGSAGNPSIGGGGGKPERERSGFMRKITTAASNSSSNVNEHSRPPARSIGVQSNQSSQPATSRVRSPKKSPQTQQTTPGETWGSQRQSKGDGDINGGPVYTAITSARDAYRSGGYPGVLGGSQAGSVKYSKSRDGGQYQRPLTSQSNGTTATSSRRLAELRKGLAARRSGAGESGPDGANDVMGVRVDVIQ